MKENWTTSEDFKPFKYGNYNVVLNELGLGYLIVKLALFRDVVNFGFVSICDFKKCDLKLTFKKLEI
jgi:hypothetical protein